MSLEKMLGQSFKGFVVGRLESNSGLNDLSPDHAKAIKKAGDLSKQLMEALTEEQKKLFSQYDQADTAVQCLAEEEAYVKGFKDGIRIAG